MAAFRRWVALGFLAVFAPGVSGCFGSFRLVNKVYEFNKSVGEKPLEEILFLVCIILPVYDLAALVDALVLNTIEFWTGNNPMSLEEGQHRERTVDLDGHPVTLTVDRGPAGMKLGVSVRDQAGLAWTFDVDRAGVSARDAGGGLLAKATTDGSGRVRAVNALGVALLPSTTQVADGTATR